MRGSPRRAPLFAVRTRRGAVGWGTVRVPLSSSQAAAAGEDLAPRPWCALGPRWRRLPNARHTSHTRTRTRALARSRTPHTCVRLAGLSQPRRALRYTHAWPQRAHAPTHPRTTRGRGRGGRGWGGWPAAGVCLPPNRSPRLWRQPLKRERTHAENQRRTWRQ